MLRFLQSYASALGRVVIRRRAVGPICAHWSVPFETAIEQLRALMALQSTMPLPAFRQHMERTLQAIPSLASRSLRTHTDQLGHVPGEWVVPKGQAPDPKRGRIVLYLHGGAYCFGSPRTHHDIVAQLATRGAVQVFSVAYRLAPEHPFPAALEDACAAYQALLARGTDPANIVLAGDSAGGGLSLSTLLWLRDHHVPLPARALLISPWVDLTLQGDSGIRNNRYDYFANRDAITCTKAYLGTAQANNPLISPLFADLTGLPPLVISGGALEMIIDEIRQLVERAKKAGVSVEYIEGAHMPHNHPFFHLLSDTAKRDLAQLVACALGKS